MPIIYDQIIIFAGIIVYSDEYNFLEHEGVAAW